MTPIPSTAEILALKMLGRNVDKRWTAWAYDMLLAGFDTENMVTLPGEMAPFNHFEMQKLTDKVFAGLNLKWDNSELVYKNYACYLIDQSVNGKKEFAVVLDILSNIYLTGDFEPPYEGFYYLYYAYDDLKYSENQYNLPGVTRENIKEVTLRYFNEWVEKCSMQF